jgi:putative membrane protein
MNNKKSTLMSLGISLALIAAGIWFLYDHRNLYGYGGSGWTMANHMWVGGGGMGIVMILFWAVVIGAIALIVSGLVSGKSCSDSPDNQSLPDALEILKRRYANGEIDKLQFDRMKEDLR